MTTIADATGPRSRISFDLKTLLLAIAGAGILLTPYQWFGGFYLFSASLSLLIVVAGALVYRHAGGVTILVAIVSVFISFLFIMASPLLFAHAILNFILSVILTLFRVKPKTFAVATAALAIGLYAFAIWGGYDRIQELTALRAQFPFKSVEDRLAFEHASNRSASTTGVGTPAPLILSRLAEFEDRQRDYRYSSRQWALQQLHENINMHFASAAGFGVMRMGHIDLDKLELEPEEPLAMPTPLKKVPALPAESDLSPIHSDVLLNFADPDRSGFVRGRNAVAGFEAHRVTSQAKIAGDGNEAVHWQVQRLELVSLLRHETPRVYVADEIPAMDQLAEVPNRALNDFEAAALPQLATAEDLVIDQQPDRIQMLGAVRAAKNCLVCHEGQRGQLLGAFSYEITPRSVAESDERADSVR